MKKKSLDIRITSLFGKYIVKRPKGNCQILFALSELDNFVDEIMEEIAKEHESINGWCCACEYDIAHLENLLASKKIK